jgi:hypothetical protein
MQPIARTTLVALALAGCHPTIVPYVPAGPPTSIHFAEDEGGTVSVVDAAHHVATCKVPCDAEVASGTATFGLSAGDGKILTGLAVVPATPSQASFHRRRHAQAVAGAVIAISGLVLGLPLTLDGVGGGVSSTDVTLGVVGVGALIVGYTLLLTAGNDGVDVN